MQVFGGLVSFADVTLTRFEDYLIEFEELGRISQLAQLHRQLGEIMAILAGADLVKDFTQAIDIRLRRAGAFGWDKTFRADVGTRLADVGHQAYVRQFRDAIHQNDVGRLNVSMDQPAPMEMGQSVAEGQADLQTLLKG